MADQGANKNLPPTEKKLEDARKEGNYLNSNDVTQTVILWAVLGMFVVVAYQLPEYFAKSYQLALQHAVAMDVKAAAIDFMKLGVLTLIGTAGLLYGGHIVGSLVSNLSQVGFVFSFVKIRKGLEFEQGLNVVSNAKNVFSKRSLATFILNLVKASVIIGIVYYQVRYDKTLVNDVLFCRDDIWCVLRTAASRLWLVILWIAIAMIPLAVIDWLVQSAIYTKENMMSHDDLHKEQKEIEGDPEIKQHRKMVARELLEGGGVTVRIANASAIVRNPTHVAIALRYEPATMSVPYVIAKGVDAQALAIIAEAEKHGIPSYIDVPLARQMIDDCEVNNFVPLQYLDKMVKFATWLNLNHPERVYQTTEIAQLTKGAVLDVRRR